MGINKVIVLLLTTIVVVSCNRPSQEAYDDLMRDNQQLKQKLEATQTKSFEQAEAMSQAMEELAKIWSVSLNEAEAIVERNFRNLLHSIK